MPNTNDYPGAVEIAEGSPLMLAGQPYVVVPLAIRPSRSWNEHLLNELEKLVTVTLSAADLTQLDMETPEGRKELLSVVGNVKAAFLGAFDVVFDLVLEYCKDLQPRREELLDVATYAEVFEVFSAVLGYAFPLEQTLKRLPFGLLGRGTLTSFAGKNGESGATSLSPANSPSSLKRTRGGRR